MSVYFAHISDTHFGPTRAYQRHGFTSYDSAVELVRILNNLPTKPDFVIHTGDVATDPSHEAYTLAAQVLRELQLPIYYVTGNHDASADLHRYLTFAPHERVGSPAHNSYTFQVGDERFLVLDGRGPDEIDPHGQLGEDQFEAVSAELANYDNRLTVFVHYPALPMNAPWMDNNMLLTNGERLHTLLVPARERIRGVFYGHIHQAMQTVRDGILYVAGASSFAQFAAWPADEMVRMDAVAQPGFGFVHLLPDQMIVHQHRFNRP